MHEPKRVAIWRNRRPRWDVDTCIIKSELDSLVEQADKNSVWGTLHLVRFKRGGYTAQSPSVKVPLSGRA